MELNISRSHGGVYEEGSQYEELESEFLQKPKRRWTKIFDTRLDISTIVGGMESPAETMDKQNIELKDHPMSFATNPMYNHDVVIGRPSKAVAYIQGRLPLPNHKPSTHGSRFTKTQNITPIVKGLPKLSKELRLKIWELLIPEARVVELEWDGYLDSWVLPHASHNKACILQSINNETREAFLKSWLPLVHRMPAETKHTATVNEKTYEFWYSDDTTLAELERRNLPAYFNPQLDAIYISPLSSYILWNPSHIAKLVSLTNLTNIRHLVLAQAVVPSSEAKLQRALHASFTLKKLTNIDMVLNDMPRGQTGLLKQRKIGSIELRRMCTSKNRELGFGAMASYNVLAGLRNRVVKDGREILFGVEYILRGGN